MARIINGWIKLHRDLLASDIVSDPELFSIWANLLIAANYRETKTMLNFEQVVIRRGQLVLGVREFAERLNISKSNFHRKLKYLEKTQRISLFSGTQGTVVTILNYNDYQDEDDKRGTPDLKNGTDVGHSSIKSGTLNISASTGHDKEISDDKEPRGTPSDKKWDKDGTRMGHYIEYKNISNIYADNPDTKDREQEPLPQGKPKKPKQEKPQIEYGCIEELNTPLLANALASVSKKTQRAWVEGWPDIVWLRRVLLEATAFAEGKRYSDMGRFYTNWLKRQHNPPNVPSSVKPLTSLDLEARKKREEEKARRDLQQRMEAIKKRGELQNA